MPFNDKQNRGFLGSLKIEQKSKIVTDRFLQLVLEAEGRAIHPHRAR